MTDTEHGTARVSGAVAEAARDAATQARVREVGPTGALAEPFCLLTRAGRTACHTGLTADRVGELVSAFEAASAWTDGAAYVVDHDPTPSRLPRPTTGPLSVGRRDALGRCGWVDPTAPPPTEFAAHADEDPEAVLESIEDSGMRGRGRGDWCRDRPIAEMWKTARDTAGDAVVVVNATETDSRVRGDALLLDGDAASILDGALTVATVVGATDVVVTVPESADRRARRLRAAAAAFDAGPTVQVTGAPVEYLVTEPTITLEAMEGADRLEARRRPPGPETYGLHGRPTVVHTPRTLAQVREQLRREAAGDDPVGDSDDPGTRLVTVTGDVERPVTVELPTDESMATAREAVTVSAEPKMACVGGRFGGLTDTLDQPVSGPGLAARGLGTEGSLELFDDSRCAVLVAGHRSKQAAAENCGRCVPCREGTEQLTDLLREVYRGSFDAAALEELVDVVGTTSLCSFGRDAARPTETALRTFSEEFEAHADGRCPSGACSKERLEAEVSP